MLLWITGLWITLALQLQPPKPVSAGENSKKEGFAGKLRSHGAQWRQTSMACTPPAIALQTKRPGNCQPATWRLSMRQHKRRHTGGASRIKGNSKHF